MPAVKANQIIDAAFTLAGIKAIGETIAGDASEWAFTLLNDLLDEWNTDGLFIADNTETIITVSGQSVTIGTGKVINVTRPVRMLDTSFFRVNNIDFPIQWINQGEYNAIPYKAITSTIPYFAYYDGGIPDGNIFFWPYPATGSELHLQLGVQFAGFVDYTTPINLAQGYKQALQYTLAERLCTGIRDVPAQLAKNAIQARDHIRVLNATVPTLEVGYGDTATLGGKARFLMGI
jgi:hypothetical protein